MDGFLFILGCVFIVVGIFVAVVEDKGTPVFLSLAGIGLIIVVLTHEEDYSVVTRLNLECANLKMENALNE